MQRLLEGSPIVASHRDGRPARAGRLLAALRAAGERRRPRHAGSRRAGRGRRARLGDRQPDGPSGRPSRVVRELPRRAGRRSRATSWRSRPPRSARSPSGEPTGCSTRRARRACRLPGRRAGRQLGADARPVHAGRDGRREPPPGRAGERRLAADERDAGGPRVDGLGRGAQAARRRSPTSRRILAVELRAPPRAASTCARRSSPAPAPARRWRPCGRPASRARAPTGGWRRSSAAAEGWSPPASSWPPSRRRSESSSERPTGGARAAREPRSPAAAGSRRPRCGC